MRRSVSGRQKQILIKPGWGAERGKNSMGVSESSEEAYLPVPSRVREAGIWVITTVFLEEVTRKLNLKTVE